MRNGFAMATPEIPVRGHRKAAFQVNEVPGYYAFTAKSRTMGFDKLLPRKIPYAASG